MHLAEPVFEPVLSNLITCASREREREREREKRMKHVSIERVGSLQCGPGGY